jgi:hypothetical protein
MQTRPAGVTLIAGCFLGLGFFSLLWGALVLGIGGLSALFGSLFGAENMTAFGNSSAWAGYLNILSAMLQIVVGFGLLGVYRWAWFFSLAAVALSIVLSLYEMFTGGTFGFICGSLWLMVPIIILIYLLTSGVRQVFGIGKKS